MVPKLTIEQPHEAQRVIFGEPQATVFAMNNRMVIIVLSALVIAALAYVLLTSLSRQQQHPQNGHDVERPTAQAPDVDPKSAALCSFKCKPRAGFGGCLARCLLDGQICDGGTDNCHF